MNNSEIDKITKSDNVESDQHNYEMADWYIQSLKAKRIIANITHTKKSDKR